jgi:trypsin
LIQSNNVWSAEFIKLTANPAGGKGGLCFGDSGGPDVVSGTNIVIAVNTYLTNGNCAGVTYSNRVDLQEVLDFINGV